MAVAKTPAYYDTATIMAVKSFVVQTPAANCKILFWHNLRHYWHAALSFNSDYTNRGVNYTKKSFMKLTPGANVSKLFTAVSYKFS
jgi:hypothetical protein